MRGRREDVLDRRAPVRRGAHRATPDRRLRSWIGARVRVRAMQHVRFRVMLGLLTAAMAVAAGVLGWTGTRLGDAVVHHLDTVVAAVLLAGSLAVVWRLSDEDRH